MALLTQRRIGILMAAEALGLAIAAVLHLSGHVHGRGEPFDANHAGIAETILCVVLAVGATALLNRSRRAQPIATVATAVATIGFLNGLNMTIRGGDWPDIAYHLITLPLLIISLAALWRMRGRPVVPRAEKHAHRAFGLRERE